MKAKNRNAAKVPTKEDVYFGERIKEARIAKGMGQKDLADLIGVSYQQLQKYESGENRVNGARIKLLVSALNRPLTFFLPDATDVRAYADPVVSSFMATKDGHAIAMKFPRITSIKARRAVMDLIDELTAGGSHG